MTGGAGSMGGGSLVLMRLMLLNVFRFYLTTVAAGILPAVEPWLPARRNNISQNHVAHNFRKPSSNPHFFRVAGCHPLRQAGKPAATPTSMPAALMFLDVFLF
jgi:hypothetical protein